MISVQSDQSEHTPPSEVSSLIADLLKGGRDLRPAQVQMAIQIEQGIAQGSTVLQEAATGTGKTMGYLVPMLRSGQTALVSTGNKALQNQIFDKDIPFLQAHLQPFAASLVKGIGNYVCRDRLEEACKDLRMFDLYPDLAQLVDLVQDEQGAFTGDFETLRFTLPTEVRQRINGDSDACAWGKCGFFDACYIRKMRERAKEARVIIVNHTLLLLDAATDGALLPQCDLLIIDEAHHLAQEATSVFTTSVRPAQLGSLLQLRAVQERTPENLYEEIGQLAMRLWSRVEQTPFGTAAKVTFREPMHEGLALATKLMELADALRKARPADQTDKESALYDKLLKRVQNLSSNFQLVFGVRPEKSNYVHYIERMASAGSTGQAGKQGATRMQVCAAPLDVAPFLKEKLFDRWSGSCIVMASATLATVGPNPAKPEENGKPNFAYFRKQVGLQHADFPKVQESILPLIFDYQHNALLYIPRGLPEPVYGSGPQVEQYIQAVANEMRALIVASHGRAFLLFSSGRMLDVVYDRIASSLPFPLLSQRDQVSRAELVRRFRSEQGAVLFGLKSFWEGVDIAGDTLSLVVIDKLPFDPPDDPVHEARVNRMKAAGENWFGEYVLPQVVLQLKQGVGRLLRTPDDRGVMAILDTRLHTKGYGKQVLGALPPARRTALLADVEEFFAHQANEPSVR